MSNDFRHELPEEWEFDFNNPPHTPPPEMVRCDHCGKFIRRDTASYYVHFRYFRRYTRYFCGEACKRADYLERLRRNGL